MIIRGDATRIPLPDCSVDAVVTDPPYLLSFMGKEWDGAGQQLHEMWAAEAFRVMKPGAHLLAFGGTRTYHRMTCAIEDAGFEVRDCLAWLYGSGFPKSLDVSKALDKMAGAEREVVGRYTVPADSDAGNAGQVIRGTGAGGFGGAITAGREGTDITAPATPEAEQWQGWGTALKPAHEPIVLARKPLTGTVAQNVLRWGTAALNVDGCRVNSAVLGSDRRESPRSGARGSAFAMGATDEGDRHNPAGRWPPNVTMDEEAARLLDEQSGLSVSRQGLPRSGVNGNGWGMTATGAEYGDTGGASRFFYVAKASRAERNAGLEGMRVKAREGTSGVNRPNQRCRICGHQLASGSPCVCPSPDWEPVLLQPQQNHHPTVKPLALMRWLVRLVTPPNGLVLDPFLGSGTTLLACAYEGMRGIGIEREAEYVEIAKGRLSQPIQGGML